MECSVDLQKNLFFKSEKDLEVKQKINYYHGRIFATLR